MSSKTLAIVSLNETLHLEPEFKEKCGGELNVLYVYDPNEQVYACEITPSFYLVPFDYYTKTRLSDDDDSEHRINILGEPIYVHCRTIEGIDAARKDTTEVEWDAEIDFEDQAYELLSSNVVHPEHALTL